MAIILDARAEKLLKGVKPDIAKVVRRAAAIATQAFTIVQGNRTQAEQNAIYAQGRSKPGPIVTWTKNSKHIGGGAVDFAALKGGKVVWVPTSLYATIGRVFKQAASDIGIGVEWGGDWKTKDWGHVQLTGVITKPAPPATPKTLTDNASLGMIRLQQVHGWPRFKAAAFIGRAQQESFRDIRTGVEGDQGTAGGGWQWRLDRRVSLNQFAKARGKPWTDWDTQIDFMVQELTTSEKRAGLMLKTATTLESACEAAMGYCRPAGFTWGTPRAGHGWVNTLNNAKALML